MYFCRNHCPSTRAAGLVLRLLFVSSVLDHISSLMYSTQHHVWFMSPMKPPLTLWTAEPHKLFVVTHTLLRTGAFMWSAIKCCTALSGSRSRYINELTERLISIQQALASRCVPSDLVPVLTYLFALQGCNSGSHRPRQSLATRTAPAASPSSDGSFAIRRSYQHQVDIVQLPIETVF